MSTKPAKTNTTVGMFVLNNAAIYQWTVYIFVPNPTGGKKIKTKMKVEFAHIPKDERNTMLQEFKQRLAAAAKAGDNPQSDDEIDTVTELASFQRMLLMRALHSFECQRPDGTLIEPTDDAKEELLNNSWAEDAIMYSYQQSLKGRNDEGN